MGNQLDICFLFAVVLIEHVVLNVADYFSNAKVTTCLISKYKSGTSHEALHGFRNRGEYADNCVQ